MNRGTGLIEAAGFDSGEFSFALSLQRERATLEEFRFGPDRQSGFGYFFGSLNPAITDCGERDSSKRR